MNIRLLGLLATLTLTGCPEDETVSCADEPLDRTCVSACISNVAQVPCDIVVDACRASSDTGRCSELLDLCDTSPEPNCNGGSDAGPDVMMPDASDAGPCGECSAPTPLCNTTTMMCVTCLSETDCSGDELCDPAGSCVACLEHSDCPDADAARCSDEGTCEPCDDAAQCTEEGQNVCSDGTCQQCTEATADTHCGLNACDPATGACTDIERESLEACEACVSDTQCETGHHCVPMNYMGTERGGYCLADSSGGCERPYSITLTERESLSGQTGVTYCGINELLATCEAVRALLDDTMCPGGADTECPESGLCRTVGALSNRCTYECVAASECINPPTPGSTCDDGSTGGVDYCGG